MLLWWASIIVPPVASEKTKVAIMLSGHARTYNMTAPSLRSMLVDANLYSEFSLFALAYSTGTRKKALRSTYQPVALTKHVTVAILRECYEQVVPRDRLFVKVVDEKEFSKKLSSKGIKNSRRFRISVMFRMIASTYDLVRAHEKRNKERFGIVLRLRFDLDLLDVFLLRPLPDPKMVVVPKQMAKGPSHFVPTQLRTRPCDSEGKARPTWVQDHVAYASSRAMETFSNGTARHVIAGPRKRQTQPEVILASSLKAKRLKVACDASIVYTILR